MELAEIFNSEKGYKPIVMTDDWQLAQLNYIETQEPCNINFLERHEFTDETFTLFKGKAVLITLDKNTLCFTKLKAGSTYNVETNLAHNIAMNEEAVIMITESRNAHLKGLVKEVINAEFSEKIKDYCYKYFKEC